VKELDFQFSALIVSPMIVLVRVVFSELAETTRDRTVVAVCRGWS